MSDLYHGEYPVDMTPAEAGAELRLRGEQQLLRNPESHEACVAKATDYVMSGDYRMAYFSMCGAYGKLSATQRLDAATVERCAIRDYLVACAAVADTQAERFAGHDASIVAACRAEAKAYRNAARMIKAQDHASRREQITAALATEPHQHGGKGA